MNSIFLQTINCNKGKDEVLSFVSKPERKLENIKIFVDILINGTNKVKQEQNKNITE